MKTEGMRIVLIRGLLRDARHWGDFPALLQSCFPDAEIITPDIPGSGIYHQQTSPNSIQAMTEALRQQIPAGKPLHLIAISMGGMIAIDWMLRYPSEIESSVLINTSMRPLSPFYQRLRWQIYPEIIRLLFQRGEKREQSILQLTSNEHQQDKDILQHWTDWQKQRPVSGKSAINQLLAAARFSVTSVPQQPVLLLGSLHDRLVSNQCSRQIQQRWKTAVYWHPQAGHDLPLDDPSWVVDRITQWLT